MSQPGKTEDKLANRSFFDYLPKEKVAELMKTIPTKVFPAGSILFREGEPGDNFYIVRLGKIRVFRKDEEGLEMELGVVGPGEGLGFLSLLTGNPRTAWAEAFDESTVCVLSKEEFDQILNDYPRVALSFVQNAAKWVQQDWVKFEEESKVFDQPTRLSWQDFILIFGITLICALSFNFANPQGLSLIPKSWSEEPIAAITPAEANQKSEKGKVLFVDARPINFYDQKHIKGALSLPADVFDIAYLIGQERIASAQQIVIYGRTISSLYDRQVAEKLRLRGYSNISILAGDLATWKKKGYPTEP